jgi:hypothetical protein
LTVFRADKVTRLAAVTIIWLNEKIGLGLKLSALKINRIHRTVFWCQEIILGAVVIIRKAVAPGGRKRVSKISLTYRLSYPSFTNRLGLQQTTATSRIHVGDSAVVGTWGGLKKTATTFHFDVRDVVEATWFGFPEHRISPRLTG